MATENGDLPMRKADKNSAHVRLLLGVYVLGGLSEHEEYSVRMHLSRCAPCRAEYDELADVPALLDLLAEDKAAGGVNDLIDVAADGRRGAEAEVRGGVDRPGDGGGVSGWFGDRVVGVDGPVPARSGDPVLGVNGPVPGWFGDRVLGVDGPVPARSGDPAEDARDAKLAAARRAARRARLVAAVAGIAAVTTGGVAAWAIGTRPTSRPEVSAWSGVHSYAWSQTAGVTASVELEGTAWGTKILLMMSHLPKNQHWTLIALTQGGAREPAASWQNTSQTSAEVPGAVAFPLSQLSRLDVVTAAGRTLVSIRVPFVPARSPRGERAPGATRSASPDGGRGGPTLGRSFNSGSRTPTSSFTTPSSPISNPSWPSNLPQRRDQAPTDMRGWSW
jgi:hypothetical protein